MDMNILEWAVLGVLGLAMFVISARVMRRGLPTLDDKRKSLSESMRQKEMELDKDRKNISSGEQLRLLRAAAEDLIRLDSPGQGFEVIENRDGVELKTPQGSWKVSIQMKEKGLKGSGRVLHGKCRWRLEGFGREEAYDDMASLMRRLDESLRGGASREPEDKSHILRRLTHLPQEPRRRKIRGAPAGPRRL